MIDNFSYTRTCCVEVEVGGAFHYCRDRTVSKNFPEENKRQTAHMTNRKYFLAAVSRHYFFVLFFLCQPLRPHPIHEKQKWKKETSTHSSTRPHTHTADIHSFAKQQFKMKKKKAKITAVWKKESKNNKKKTKPKNSKQ